RVEDLDVSRMSILRCNRGSRGALDIFLVRIRSENRNVNLLPERGELLDRRRPLQIAGANCDARPCFLSSNASFAAEVVLPEPFNPTIRILPGLPSSSGAASPPSKIDNSS